MKRLLIGLFIGIATFLIGLLPWSLSRENGRSHCVIEWDRPEEPKVEYGIYQLEYVSEQREIYNSVLESELYGKRMLVVSEMTTPGEWFAGVDPNKQMAALDRETFDSYKAGNDRINYIGDLIRKQPDVTVLRDNDSWEIFRRNQNGWLEFAKRFPKANGFVQLSAVGFNLDHSQALVSVEHQCGGLCGDGKFLLLKKVNGVWRVQRKITTWES